MGSETEMDNRRYEGHADAHKEHTNLVLTKGDCLVVLGEMTRVIEVAQAGMGKGVNDQLTELGDHERNARIEAARICRARLINMMKWKGMEVDAP